MSQHAVIPHGAPVHGNHNLPVRPPDRLFGRDSDLASVHLVLKAGTAVLLHGPAGIGKTALAAALASGYAELPGGVIWFETAHDSFQSLLNRITRAYGSTIPDTDHDQAIAIVRDLLHSNRPMIVLDGHVNLEAAREFVRQCAGGVPLLLTHTTMAPGPWTPHEVGPLGDDDAEAMLIHQAGRSAGESQLAGLSRALEGHALSIVVAAHQIANTDPDTFLSQIPAGETNRPMGVLMAAYRLLPPALQGMVLLLGTTFTGSASDELLSNTGGAPVSVIRPAMRQLVTRGFAVERMVDDQLHFATHELIQAFAQAFLRGKQQLEAMQMRQLRGVLTYLRQYTRDNTPAAHNRLAAEISSILEAGVFAAQHNLIDQLQNLIDMLGPVTSDSFVGARGFEQEFNWLKYLTKQPGASNDGLLAISETPITVVEEPRFEAAIASRAYPPAAEIPVVEGQPLAEKEAQPDDGAALDEAEDEFEIPEPEVWEVVPDLGEEVVEIEASIEPEIEEILPDLEPMAAMLEADVSDIEEELNAFMQGESVSEEQYVPPVYEELVSADDALTPLTMPEFEEMPDTYETAETPSVDADMLLQMAQEAQDPALAIANYSQALAAYQSSGRTDEQLDVLVTLSALSLEQDDYDNALTYLDQGLDLAEQLDKPRQEGRLLVMLGDLQFGLGKRDGAETAYREAVSVLRPVEDWLNIGLALEKLGYLYLDLGRVEDALAVLEQSAPILERAEQLDHVITVLDEIGDTYVTLLNWDKAQHHYTRALTLAQQTGDLASAFEQYYQLGQIAEVRKNRDSAALFYRRALHTAFEMDKSEEQGETLLALGRLLIDDTVQLNRVIQILEEASILLPANTEVQRLLRRAKTRRSRLSEAGVTLLLAEDSLQNYAHAADEAAQT